MHEVLCFLLFCMWVSVSLCLEFRILLSNMVQNLFAWGFITPLNTRFLSVFWMGGPRAPLQVEFLFLFLFLLRLMAFCIEFLGT